MRDTGSIAIAATLLSAASAVPVALSAEKSMICAVSEVRECTPFGTTCKRVSPQDVNTAPIVLLDLEKKELTSISMGDTGRKESVEGVKSTDDAIYLYGQQDDTAWSAVISLKTGSFTSNVSTVGTGFVLFGNCAPK